MNIRDMSFGELLKVGFWITFAPVIAIFGLMAVIGIPIGMMSAEAISVEIESQVNAIQILFGGILITLAIFLFAAIASLIEAVIGVIFVRLYTWIFMTRPAE